MDLYDIIVLIFVKYVWLTYHFLSGAVAYVLFVYTGECMEWGKFFACLFSGYFSLIGVVGKRIYDKIISNIKY